MKLRTKKGRLQSAGGGLVSTASDYMKFCQMLLNEGAYPGGYILKKETVQAMMKHCCRRKLVSILVLAWVFSSDLDWARRSLGEYS